VEFFYVAVLLRIRSTAANEDIQYFYVRKSGISNIIGVLAGLVSHGG
jgi:hypothetical protein